MHKIQQELGYCADPQQSKNENVIDFVTNTQADHFFASPSNMSFHNFATKTKIPSGTANLLGLNLKFCLEEPTPKRQYKKMQEDYARFSKCFRLHFKHNKDEPSDPTELEYKLRKFNDEISYLPKLYIRSDKPIKPTTKHNEAILASFYKRLEILMNDTFKTKDLNLTKIQRITMGLLAARKDILVIAADKNLGPAIIERDKYIKAMLEQHLLNIEYYIQIKTTTIKQELTIQRNQFLDIYARYKKNIILRAERDYFTKALSINKLLKYTIPQMYGTPKVHKPLWNRQQCIPKFRPVVTCINTVPEVFSKYCNHKMDEATKRCFKTIIKDNTCIRTSLMKKFKNGVPAGARLFSLDATVMYNNCQTDHTIYKIRYWLEEYQQTLDPTFPAHFIIKLLDKIMRNNIFQFGDTY